MLVLVWWRHGDRWPPAAPTALVAAGSLLYPRGAAPTVVGFPSDSFGSGEDFNVGLRFFLTGGIPIGGEITREAVGDMRTAMDAWYALWMLAFLTVRPSGGRLWFTGALSLASLTYAWSDLGFRRRTVECVPLSGPRLWEWRAALGAVAMSPGWHPGVRGRAP